VAVTGHETPSRSELLPWRHTVKRDGSGSRRVKTPRQGRCSGHLRLVPVRTNGPGNLARRRTPFVIQGVIGPSSCFGRVRTNGPRTSVAVRPLDPEAPRNSMAAGGHARKSYYSVGRRTAPVRAGQGRRWQELQQIEQRRNELEAVIAAGTAEPPPPALHPNMAGLRAEDRATRRGAGTRGCRATREGTASAARVHRPDRDSAGRCTWIEVLAGDPAAAYSATFRRPSRPPCTITSPGCTNKLEGRPP
jgi:hypothetical protein